MGGFNFYMQGVQRLLREAKQDLENVSDLLEYVNEARRELAGRTQCIRRLTPISGSVVDSAVVSGGSGYSSSTTISITPPDFPSGRPPNPLGLQATASLIINSGVIQSAPIQVGGDGYFQPIATIIDPTGAGSGAEVTLTISKINQLNPGQEEYSFSDIDVTMFPGVAAVHAIKSVSVIYANYRYSLPCYAFSVYQAMIRQYPFQYQYVPTFCSQFGQGAAGSFYAYPLPSQLYQWEFDCFCLPQDLTDNNSVDVIPQPWDDVVKFYAAALAFMELQNFNAAEYHMKKFDDLTLRKSQQARIGRVVNPYGRY